MNRQWLLIAIVLLAGFILGAVACQETPQASGDSRVSDFLEIGKYYYAESVLESGIGFTVLEITNDSWILADTSYGEAWLNVNQLVYVEEY